MKTKTIGLSALAAVSMAALIGGAALAQQAAPQPTERHARADTDGDGRISQAEFVQGRIARLSALDTNHDGSVTVEEMRAARQARGAERAAARFDRLDADKNGEISRSEFDAPRAARADSAAGEHRMGRMGPGRHGGMGGGRMGGHGMGRMGHGAGQRMANHGPVVISEAQTKLTEAFTRLDANHDGYLTQDERQAGRAAMRERFQERRAERRAQRQAAPTQASPSAPASE